MLRSSTIRFAVDTFGDALIVEPVETPTEEPVEEPPARTKKKALLVSNTAINCTKLDAVDEIVITGNEPTDSKRRVVFKIDGSVYRFNNNQLEAFGRDVTVDNVLNYGNTVATLTGLAEANLTTAFAGKKIYPIIALRAYSDSENLPTIKIAVKGRSFSDTLANTITPTDADTIYKLGDEPQTITEITANTTGTTANATVELAVRLRNDEDWSSYMSLAEAVDKQADAVQFQRKFTVTTTDGTDSAKLNSITVHTAEGQTIVTGSNARIFSTVENFGLDLQGCYVVVRHDPLIDSEIDTYVNFMSLPKSRELITIGIGTGARQELVLGDPDKNIVASSIKLYVNGRPFDDFDFSTEISTVILTAPNGAVITASYDYDYGVENWLQMTPQTEQPYLDDDGTYSTRFFYNLSSSDTLGKKISNVQIRLRKRSGSATETLGVGTGTLQLFTLKHKPKISTIAFTNAGTFSYDETTELLSVVAPAGTPIVVNYDWQGVAPVIHQYAAGWIPNVGYDYTGGQPTIISGGSGSDYILPTMSESIKGGAKVGENLYMVGDTLNASVQPYDLPTMSESIKGGAYLGANLYMTGDTLNASAQPYNLPTASASVKGGVKVGNGLEMDGDTLNCTVQSSYTLPTMSESIKGGAMLGNSLIIIGDKLNVALGTTPLTIEGSMWIHVP